MIDTILKYLDLTFNLADDQNYGWKKISDIKTHDEKKMFIIGINNVEYILKIYNQKYESQYENEKKILEKINDKIYSPKLIYDFLIDIGGHKKYCLILEKINGIQLNDFPFISVLATETALVNSLIDKSDKIFLESDFINIFSNIIQQYHKLHELNIVHLDIHEKNILVCQDNKICLLDFEVSFEFDAETHYSINQLENEPFQKSYTYDNYNNNSIQEYFINLEYGKILHCMIELCSKYNISKYQFDIIVDNCKINNFSNEILFSCFNYLVLHYADFGGEQTGYNYLRKTKKKYDFYFRDNPFYNISNVMNTFYKKCVWFTIKEHIKNKIYLMYYNILKQNIILKIFTDNDAKKYENNIYCMKRFCGEYTPKLIDNFYYRGTHYLITENFNGIVLNNKIFLDENEIINIFKQIFDMIKILQKYGIRNIATDSILVGNTVKFSEKYYIRNNLIQYPYNNTIELPLFDYLDLIDVGKIFLILLEKCYEINILLESYMNIFTQLELDYIGYTKLLFYYKNVVNRDTLNIERINEILKKYNITIEN